MMTIPAGLALSYRKVFVCATTSSVYEFLGRHTRKRRYIIIHEVLHLIY
jgi:hypothetical protein